MISLKAAFVTFLLVSLSIWLIAQTRSSDSTQNRLLDARAELIKEIRQVELTASISPELAKKSALSAMAKARQMQDDSLIMATYFSYCLVLQNLIMFDSALWYTVKAGKIAFDHGYQSKIAEYYNFMARYHWHLNHADSAMYYLQIYEDFFENSDVQGRRRWLPQQEMALLYMDMEDFKEANVHMEKAIAFARIEKIPMDYLYVLYSALDLYNRQDSLMRISALTEEYLKFKLERGTDILDTSQHISLFLPGSDAPDRLTGMQRYLKVSIDKKDYLSAMSYYHAIGTIYVQRGSDADALHAFEAALNFSYRLSYPKLRYNMHSAVFATYDRMGHYANALLHHKAMAALMDSIRNEEREKSVRELEVKYETAEKERALAESNYQLVSARRRQQLYGFALFAFLIVSASSIYAYRQKKRSLSEVAKKNVLITRALEEKDILLREIHHRVKNNLQMISALLYLHGKSVNDSSAQEALLESQNRVQSMAMIHQNLYQDENLLGVGVKSYLDRLLNHLIASYNIAKDRIDIKTRIEIDRLDIDTIVPLALIVNELISNCLKYAFSDGRTGAIDVYFGRTGDQIKVEVKDNGVGLPSGFDINTQSNFGYKLINILSERLGATLSTTSAQGTIVSLSIPVKTAA